jgi:hypothetical protein
MIGKKKTKVNNYIKLWYKINLIILIRMFNSIVKLQMLPLTKLVTVVDNTFMVMMMKWKPKWKKRE